MQSDDDDDDDEETCPTCGNHFDDCPTCYCPNNASCLVLCEQENGGRCPHDPSRTHCGRGCQSGWDVRCCCEPDCPAKNTLQQFLACPMRIPTAVFHMGNDRERYERACAGDYGYFEEIGLRGDDLNEAIAEYKEDNDWATCGVCRRETDQICGSCATCDIEMCDRCGRCQADDEREDAPWFCPEHFPSAEPAATAEVSLFVS